MRQDVKDFFLKEYNANLKELRAKAANPKSRKRSQWESQAQELEAIIRELEAA